MQHTSRRRLLMAACGAIVATTAVVGSSMSAAAWPEKPITMIVPFGAGGGTDATGRMLATLMEKTLGQPINVVNRPGGNGLVGHAAIGAAAPDGYTIGIATTESTSYKPMGLSDFQPTRAYTPIAIYNRDSTSVLVNKTSKYQSLGDLLAGIKAGEKPKLSTGGAFGGSYQVAFGLLLLDQGLDPTAPVYVSAQGSAAGLQEMVSGGLDVTLTTLPEAASLIQAGRVRPLATISDTRSATYPDVPTSAEAAGANVTFGSWRGVMAPAGLPPEVGDKLRDAIRQAIETEEFKAFMGNRGFSVAWLTGQELTDFMAASESAMATGLKEIGLSK